MWEWLGFFWAKGAVHRLNLCWDDGAVCACAVCVIGTVNWFLCVRAPHTWKETLFYRLSVFMYYVVILYAVDTQMSVLFMDLKNSVFWRHAFKRENNTRLWMLQNHWTSQHLRLFMRVITYIFKSIALSYLFQWPWLVVRVSIMRLSVVFTWPVQNVGDWLVFTMTWSLL